MSKTNTYKPINCDLHSVLEHYSIRKETVSILYLNTLNEKVIVQTKIVDLYTKNREEFLVMSNTNTIRLDQIIQINETSFDTSSCTTT